MGIVTTLGFNTEPMDMNQKIDRRRVHAYALYPLPGCRGEANQS